MPMNLNTVSTNRFQPTSLFSNFVASLESRINHIALALLAAVVVTTITYVISSSLPITLLVSALTLLVLSIWLYYSNRSMPDTFSSPTQDSLPDVVPAPPLIPTTPVYLEKRNDSFIEKPAEMDACLASQKSLDAELFSITTPSLVSYDWQKKLESLMFATLEGCTPEHIETCRTILEKNKEHLNDFLQITKKKKESTILHLLAKIGPAPFVLIFKEYGADFTCVDKDSFNNTALHWAIANANNAVALEIIHHAPVHTFNMQCEFGNTPLHLAIAKGYTDLNADGKKVKYPNFELTKALVEKGARIDIANYELDPLTGGNTAFHIACARRDCVTLTLLMTKNPDLTLRNYNSQTGPDLIELTYKEACNFLATITPAFILDENTFNQNETAARAIVCKTKKLSLSKSN
jgi:ankyrin repeat protein